MTRYPRFARPLLLLTAIAGICTGVPLSAQQTVPAPATPTPTLPASLQTGDEAPWIYRGSDVPRDKEWLFGEMENGLRYAVRRNGVPPNQMSIRIRIDAGSLHEEDSERGYAHLLEHLLFRESKYLGAGEAIPTWQRLGATFGSDTNAETSPTHTVYKLDLPNIGPDNGGDKLDESFKLLSGMIREPALSAANLAADIPIVLAEKRERGGPSMRVLEATRSTIYAGQRLADRMPIGTTETLTSATPASVRAFHSRWYRPENTVIVAAGDADPVELARLVERWFADWQGEGPLVPAPDFGDPVAPAGADPANPVGATRVLVEPDLPRSFSYGIMRPWRPVDDTIEYNEGLMIDAVSQAIINRRLEKRARAGGSYLYAQVQQDDVSRSTDATFVSFAPLSDDWRAALADVRGVIKDALDTPPTQEEIDRELSQFEVVFASSVAEREVMAGAKLADTVVQAVDIREAVAAPETVLTVFNGMRDQFTPANVQKHTRQLFTGDVLNSIYVTPSVGEADDSALRTAFFDAVQADGSARLAASDISFDTLPPLGEPGTIVSRTSPGLFEIEDVAFDNGVKAVLWSNKAEPGRVVVRVRFGGGYRAFGPDDAAYATLGRMALVGSGIGELGQEQLDRISTGRKLGFDFAIAEGVFTLTAQTRQEDLADQLYLFAGKLGNPSWDPNPVIRAKAASTLTYESLATSPAGVLQRDFEYLIRGNQSRFQTATPDQIAAVTPESFREFWAEALAQGPVEVLVFGDFETEPTLEALRTTFGAIEPRAPLPDAIASRVPGFPEDGSAPVVVNHRGDDNQAAAVIAWPGGAGSSGLRESRQLEILTDLFNNRLVDEMRERVGASYSPSVSSDWPVDIQSGGSITALAQLKPEDVPSFFAAADAIALDLAQNPPSADELARVTEPFNQLIRRASTGNTFWLYQLEGSTVDPVRRAFLRTLLVDYTETTPARMQALAQRYLAQRPGWRMAILPEGQDLPPEAKVLPTMPEKLAEPAVDLDAAYTGR
ncbi:M16 family metallopeptidase [Alteripontixanthobacter maritimus]